MSHPNSTPGVRSTTVAVLAMLVIPVVSVSSAVLLADVAPSTSPDRVVWGLLALLTGVVAGLGVSAAARFATVGVGAAAAALGWARPCAVGPPPPVAADVTLEPLLVPVRSVRSAPISRRGPPFGLM